MVHYSGRVVLFFIRHGCLVSRCEIRRVEGVRFTLYSTVPIYERLCSAAKVWVRTADRTGAVQNAKLDINQHKFGLKSLLLHAFFKATCTNTHGVKEISNLCM